jgi:hypothetical protein
MRNPSLLMSTFHPRTFTTPGILKSIKTDLLLRLFAPHRHYFEQIGAPLPSDHDHHTIDCECILNAFARTETPNPPPELVDAMTDIDDLANEAGCDALERELSSENPHFRRPQDIEDANFVLMVWHENPALVERVNARNFAFEGRSYLSFRADEKTPLPEFKPPTDSDRDALRAQLGRRFAHVYPAESFRVMFYAEADGGRFVVRHGGPLIREGIISPSQPAESASQVFRRELFDVIIYSPAHRELRLHARSKRDHDIYTRAFGAHLLNDEDAFPDSDKYTLQPLLDKGADALACEHIPGLRSVKLTEFTITVPGGIKESFTRRATDVFEIGPVKDHGLPSFGRLVKARFEIRVADARHGRTVTVIVPNKAKYKRDSDGELVDQWLRDAGFVLENEPAAALGHSDATTDS